MSGGLQFLLRSRLTVDVHGADELGETLEPVVIAANYASPADPLLVVAALPRAWRRRLVVCLPDDAGRAAWRPPRRTVVVGGDSGRTAAGVLDDALEENRSVLCFPEDARSRDGFLAAFRPEIVAVPLRRDVAVVPVGLRGSYAAVPDEWRWVPSGWSSPGRSRVGRPRVSVRFGTAMRARTDESPVDFGGRLESEVQRLIAEDASSWWDTQRQADGDALPVPSSSWRRIWAQTEVSTAGGRPRRAKIWRS